MNIQFINTWLQSYGLEDVLVRQVVEALIIIIFTMLVSFISGMVFHHIEQQSLKSANLWDDTLIHSARPTIKLAIWILGLSLLGYSVQSESEFDISNFLNIVQHAGIIFCLTWFIVRFISRGEKIVISAEKMKQPMDETTVSAIGKLMRGSIILIAILVILQTLGYSISGVLAFGGVGGLAVGFAAKDLLANFFGGLMVYMDRPFKVGDWVRSPDKDIEGTVVKIGWRLTTIITFDKRPLYVPNAIFTSIAVQNPSRMSHRRIYETIGLRYEDAGLVADIIAQVKEMLLNHDEIDSSQTLIVNFNAYSSSSLDFFIYTFTKTTDWIHYHNVKQEVLLKILDIIGDAGAQVAFPTSTVHIPEAITHKTDLLKLGTQA